MEYSPPRGFRSNQRTAMLLASCALANVLAFSAQESRAQAFQGTPSVVAGTALIGIGPGYTSIEVIEPETVITWTPFSSGGGGPLDFLPAGSLAEFFTNNLSDYTVLNRIIPSAFDAPISQVVALNGSIESRIGAGPGGNVWFYTPTGFVIGPNAVINVGGLVITTNDIVFGAANTGGSELFDSGGYALFRGGSDPSSFVEIQAGASISGTLGNSYVALVSPRIVQSGNVQADGSVAYVAAEQVDLRIGAGMFDIVIGQGTDDPNGIVHTGTTGGAASSGAANTKTISLVAVPKNTALTMLLSGSIGYVPAASAANDGSTIVLTAGDLSSPAGNISIGDTNFRNSLQASATGFIELVPTTGSAELGAPGGTISFGSTTSLNALNSVTLTAGHGSSITAAGDMWISSAGDGSTGGTITIEALSANGLSPAGAIIFDGVLGVDASARDPGRVGEPDGASVEGGSVSILANGGTIHAYQLFVDVSGLGGSAFNSGGDGRGGSVQLRAGYGGSIQTIETLISAVGRGGRFFDSASLGPAGIGYGGTITVADSGTGFGTDTVGGLLSLGDVSLDARGIGGARPFMGVGASGDSFGGAIDVSLGRRNQTFNSFSATTNSIDGEAAFDPVGGTITMTVSGGITVDVLNDLVLSADAIAGVNGPPGAFALGGTVDLNVLSGATLNVSGSLFASANASVGRFFGQPDTTPDVTGGTVNILADGGHLNVQSMTVRADAEAAGALTSAGTARGGTVLVGASNTGSISITGLSAASPIVVISASGFGSDGPSPAAAFGGSATLFASDGTISSGIAIDVLAEGRVGSNAGLVPGSGFAATGGTASVEIRAGTSGTGSITVPDLLVSAAGNAALVIPAEGPGGSGTGGSALVNIAAGTFSPGNLLLNASGTGGAAAAAVGNTWQSGNGQGGLARFTISGGTATPDSLTMTAEGVGAAGALATSGMTMSGAGDGVGGTAQILTSGGSLSTGLVSINARGLGGAGGFNADIGAGGNGGTGTGGTAHLSMPGGSSALLTLTGATSINAEGLGGAGGNSVTNALGDGGAGTGGSSTMTLADGRFDMAAVQLTGSGVGGVGNVTGLGTGGSANFSLVDSGTATASPRSIAGLTIEANGVGGTSVAGTTEFTAQVGNTGAALAIEGDLTIEASGVDAPAGNGFVSAIAGATVTVTGLVKIATGRDASMAIGTGGALNSTGSFTADIGRTFTSTGSGGIGSLGASSVTAATGISIANLASGGTTLLRATNGTVGVANLLSTAGVTAEGQSVTLGSTGGLTITKADATAGDVVITTTGELSAAQVSATGAANLSSTGGNLTTTGPVTGATIGLTGDNVNATGAVTSSGGLAVDARSGFTLSATATGTAIDVAAAEITITAAGQLGTRGRTTDIRLINRNTATRTFLGGASQAGSFSVDNAEVARLFADNSITFAQGVGAGPVGDFLIGDLAMSFGATGNVGAGGTIKVDTTGLVEVNGAVVMNTVSAADTFSIDPSRIDVIAGSGSIVMRDGTGNLLGLLELQAGTIAVADRATLDAIASAPDFASIIALLDKSGLAGPAEGYLQAGTIEVTADSAFYIQNAAGVSGFADRRGFTAGALNIQTGSSATRLALNGVITGLADPLTGLDTVAGISINGIAAAPGGQFDPLSSVNGCAIGSNCALGRPAGSTAPTGNQLEGVITTTLNGGPAPQGQIFDRGEIEPMITLPLVDEPITGVGNDDLWQTRCSTDQGACTEVDGSE